MNDNGSCREELLRYKIWVHIYEKNSFRKTSRLEPNGLYIQRTFGITVHSVIYVKISQSKHQTTYSPLTVTSTFKVSKTSICLKRRRVMRGKTERKIELHILNR